MKKLILITLFLCSNFLFGQQMIKNLQWRNVNEEITELSVGKGVTLFAETENIDDGEPVNVIIWSKGDENDDLVGEYLSRVVNNQIVFNWILIFDYEKLQNNLREIEEKGYTSPLYYFTLQYKTRKSQNSELLAVRARIRLMIAYEETGEPHRNSRIMLLFPDDTELETRTDAEGYLNLDNIKVFGKVYFLQWKKTRNMSRYCRTRNPNNPLIIK